MRYLLGICASVALLAGCAHRGPEVAVSGAPLPAAKSFAITEDRPPVGVEPAIAAALVSAGLRPAASDQTPDYLVQIAYADRPAKMGAYVPGPTAAAPPAAWLQQGVKPGPTTIMRKGARSLNVAVIDNATGQDVRKVSASQHYWRAKPEAVAQMGPAVAQALNTP